jgi:hypothetical protein
MSMSRDQICEQQVFWSITRVENIGSKIKLLQTSPIRYKIITTKLTDFKDLIYAKPKPPKKCFQSSTRIY